LPAPSPMQRRFLPGYGAIQHRVGSMLGERNRYCPHLVFPASRQCGRSYRSIYLVMVNGARPQTVCELGVCVFLCRSLRAAWFRAAGAERHGR
jgi:hypothetical protein